MLLEKREHRRYATNLDGRLLWIGQCNLFCVVIDLSEAGARVRTRHGVYIPNRVFLWIKETGDVWDCNQKWSRDNELGLRFFGQAGGPKRMALLDMCRPPVSTI